MAKRFENQFSWSFSRHKTFSDCHRQYYLQYYGSWGGWNEDAADSARLAYRLKNMQTLPMWLGDLVHRMIERILGDLRNRELNTLEAYQKQARDCMNREWAQSLDKQWMWKPKLNLNLFEHYYGLELSGDDRLAAREKVYTSLANFMESELFKQLASLRPDAWKSVEKLDQFVVGDQPIYVKVDCAIALDDTLWIYDWKTGKETEDTVVQLGCYALYAYQVWRYPLEKQKLISYYLHPNTIHEHAPSADQLIETKDFIFSSMEKMIGKLCSNVAKNQAEEKDFERTGSRSTCRRCNFREICFGTKDWKEE